MGVLEKLVDIYNRELGYKNSSQHLYTIEVLDNEKFIENMRNAGIVCGVHYPALHKNPIYNNNMIKNNWEISFGFYPGILIGFRSYKEKKSTNHVAYLPFVDVCLTIFK